MNNIHEKDWAEDSWSGHTGMDNFSDYCFVNDKTDEVLKDKPEAVTAHNGIAEQE